MRDARAKGFSRCPFCGEEETLTALPLLDSTPYWERECFFCPACRSTFDWVRFFVGGQCCWAHLEREQPEPGERIPVLVPPWHLYFGPIRNAIPSRNHATGRTPVTAAP